MLQRREFVLGSAAAVTGTAGCSGDAGAASYAESVRRTWRPGSRGKGGSPTLALELVRYATLAPSSHNTQCWHFRIDEQGIEILPDLARRCPVVDPDDHHLFVSLGCATENLLEAALANGLMATPGFDIERNAVSVRLESTRPSVTPRFLAIPERQCTRGDYDGRPLSADELGSLRAAGTGDGVRVQLITGRPAMESVLEYIVEGNTTQLNDPAFVAELKTWIRFGEQEAVRAGDGLFGPASGNPAIPRWLGSRIFNLVASADRENDKCARQVRSSAGLAVFVSEREDKAHWIEAGRCYERFALQATALGIRNAFLNQPVEVPALRRQFAAHLQTADRRPDLLVRFGRGPLMPRSLRRPVPEVIA
ncbi:MAG: Tat pathway signal protein [Gammaproteobacteria bacterium]